MTTQPAEPQSRQRSSWPWLIAAIAVVVVAAVGTLFLTTDDTESDAPKAATTAGADKPDTGYDLSTPEAAAKSFAAAAKTGSGDTLLGLACVGRPACAREHAVSDAQLTEAQDTIREGVYELGDHLKSAEFTSAVDGDEPGTKKVPYRTPEMTGDAYLTLTFVQSDGDWLFYSPTA
jgi:hypothetical protein